MTRSKSALGSARIAKATRIRAAPRRPSLFRGSSTVTTYGHTDLEIQVPQFIFEKNFFLRL